MCALVPPAPHYCLAGQVLGEWERAAGVLGARREGGCRPGPRWLWLESAGDSGRESSLRGQSQESLFVFRGIPRGDPQNSPTCSVYLEQNVGVSPQNSDADSGLQARPARPGH